MMLSNEFMNTKPSSIRAVLPAKYWCGLFCYEEFCDVEEVIKREKQQKNTKEHSGLT
jgi:hypothetical protein